MLQHRVNEQLHAILIESIQPNEPTPFQLAKFFYRSCLNEVATEEHGLKPLIRILSEFGGWPIIEYSGPDNFDWIEILKKFRHIGLNMDSIFSLSVESDARDSTRNILTVSHTDILVNNKERIARKYV